LPPDSASPRVQVDPVQVHPVPDMEPNVNPDGSVSVTVTVPVVVPLPVPLDTVRVYVPLWPCVKLPWCDLAILSTGLLPVTLTAPFPPATVTLLPPASEPVVPLRVNGSVPVALPPTAIERSATLPAPMRF